MKAKPFGYYCELVHVKSGEVIRDVFVREAPLKGADGLRGYRWRSIPLYRRA